MSLDIPDNANEYLISHSKSHKHFFLKWRKSQVRLPREQLCAPNFCICVRVFYCKQRHFLQLCVLLLLPLCSHFLPKQTLLHFHFCFENSLYINHFYFPKNLWNLLNQEIKGVTQYLKGYFLKVHIYRTKKSSVLPIVCCCEQENIEAYKHKKEQHSKSFHLCILNALVLLRSAQGYNRERKRVLPEASQKSWILF